MKTFFKAMALGAVVMTVAVSCQNKKVAVSSSGLRSVYFDFDNSFVRNDQVSALQGNGSYLKTNPGMVTIEGHCDERGTNEYNLALGQRRAESARNYLMNLGVSSANMRTVSFGEEKGVCYDHNEGCWWKNRRADFRK